MTFKRRSMFRARRAASFLIAFGVVFSSIGCAGSSAPAAYKAANEARLAAVGPWLQQFAADHPDKRQRVSDVLASWGIEVSAQRGVPADTGTGRIMPGP